MILKSTILHDEHSTFCTLSRKIWNAGPLLVRVFSHRSILLNQ